MSDQHSGGSGPDEPTTAPPPYAPPGAPPAWSRPEDLPTAPVPQYGAPPAAPPQYAPPGAPPPGAPQYAPPQYGAPPPGAPQYGAPPPGAQPYGTQPQFGPAGYGAQQPLGAPVPPTETSKPKRTGLIVALVVVVLLVAGGIVGVALLTFVGTSGLELTIDTCEIAADGTLSASGTVAGPSGTGVEVQVDFIDTATGNQADSSTVVVDLGTTSGGDPWTATGTAGDQVQQVSCDVTAGE